MTAHIRRALPPDVTEITAMIHQLADFERAAEHCTVVETQISTALFDEPAILRAHVAIGAQAQRQWTTYRVSGPELAELAEPR